MSLIEQQVINTILERAKIGFKKYGISMERNDLSLIEWLNHLQQQLLDASIYSGKIIDVLKSLNSLEGIITNEYGVICPMPLSLWPTWANYAAVDDFGYLAFFESKPEYDVTSYGWKELTNITQIYWQKVKFDDKTKAFWEREKINNYDTKQK